MSVIGEPLFFNRNHTDIGDLARHYRGKLQEAVDNVPQAAFDAKSDDEIVAQVAKEMSFDPLIVNFENMEKAVEETTLQVTDRYGFHDGPIEVPALRATKSIPFSGDAGLWQVMTGSWSSVMPRGEVRGNRLVVGITVRADQANEAKDYIDRTVSEIQEYLPRQREQIDSYNASLPGLIRPLVEVRRQRRSKAANLLDSL